MNVSLKFKNGFNPGEFVFGADQLDFFLGEFFIAMLLLYYFLLFNYVKEELLQLHYCIGIILECSSISQITRGCSQTSILTDLEIFDVVVCSFETKKKIAKINTKITLQFNSFIIAIT